MRKIVLLVSLLLLGAGCPSQPSVPSINHEGASHADPHAGHVMPSAGTAKSAGERITVVEKPTADERGTLAFVLNDASGKPLGSDRLAIAHEKKLHLILVDSSSPTYFHLHPEFKDGQWRVETEMPFGGYLLYADFVPLDGSPEVLYTTFTVGPGRAMIDEFPVPGKDDRVTDGNVSASMRRTGDGYAFSLSQNGKAVSDVRPYLGAYGHVVILKYGQPDVYIHAHPMSEAKPVDGTVEFMGALPGPGRYTAFAQFDVGGAIRTFSYTFDQE